MRLFWRRIPAGERQASRGLSRGKNAVGVFDNLIYIIVWVYLVSGSDVLGASSRELPLSSHLPLQRAYFPLPRSKWYSGQDQSHQGLPSSPAELVGLEMLSVFHLLKKVPEVSVWSTFKTRQLSKRERRQLRSTERRCAEHVNEHHNDLTLVQVLCIQADVTKEQDVERAVDEAVKEFGRIDYAASVPSLAQKWLLWRFGWRIDKRAATLLGYSGPLRQPGKPMSLHSDKSWKSTPPAYGYATNTS